MMDSILIRELVDIICEYLSINDIINFHQCYNYPLSIKWYDHLYKKHKDEIYKLEQKIDKMKENKSYDARMPKNCNICLKLTYHYSECDRCYTYVCE